MPSLSARVGASAVAVRVLYTDGPGVPDAVLKTVPVVGNDDAADVDWVAGGDRAVVVPLAASEAVEDRRMALVALGVGGVASPLSAVVTITALVALVASAGQTKIVSGAKSYTAASVVGSGVITIQDGAVLTVL